MRPEAIRIESFPHHPPGFQGIGGIEEFARWWSKTLGSTARRITAYELVRSWLKRDELGLLESEGDEALARACVVSGITPYPAKQQQYMGIACSSYTGHSGTSLEC